MEPPKGSNVEDELSRFAREMAELTGDAGVAEATAQPIAQAAAPKVVTKTISAAPQRSAPKPEAASAAPAPPQPYNAYGAAYAQAGYYGGYAHAPPPPSSLPAGAGAASSAGASGSGAGDLASRRNEELRAATAAVAYQAHVEHAHELQTAYKAQVEHANELKESAAAHATGGAAAGGKPAAVKRAAAGVEWEDATLADWPDNDFRLFVGNLGNDATDALLAQAFSKYPSFQRARAVRDKRYNKPAGYGFVSFKEPWDMTAAMREMENKYVGSRPIKLKKSTWKDRSADSDKQPEWELHKVKTVEQNKKKKPRTVKNSPW